MKLQWGTILKNYGPVATIALFLVWWLTQTFEAGQRDMRDDMKTLKQELGAHVTETNHLMFRVCINTAGTDPSLLAGCQEGRR